MAAPRLLPQQTQFGEQVPTYVRNTTSVAVKRLYLDQPRSRAVFSDVD